MSDDDVAAVTVLTDEGGNYYLLSPQTLLRTRVPAEYAEDVRRLVEERGIAADERAAPTESAGRASWGVAMVSSVELAVAELGGFGVATIQSPIPRTF